MNNEKVSVRFGIIGAGMIAAFHAEAIKSVENAELKAVYDRILRAQGTLRLSRVSRRTPILKSF